MFALFYRIYSLHFVHKIPLTLNGWLTILTYAWQWPVVELRYVCDGRSMILLHKYLTICMHHLKVSLIVHVDALHEENKRRKTKRSIRAKTESICIQIYRTCTTKKHICTFSRVNVLLRSRLFYLFIWHFMEHICILLSHHVRESELLFERKIESLFVILNMFLMW